jgi:DNA-binding NarL/FixJ family response regulator
MTACVGAAMRCNPEREVLVMLAPGIPNKEIADKLHLAEGTVENHVSNILGKLQAQNRTEAADIARKRGLI